MDVSAFDKISLVFGALVLGVYVASFASPQWLVKKDYEVPEFKPFEIIVNIKMGLFRACVSKPNLEKLPDLTPEESCGTDGAKGWQFTAAGLAIAALVLSVLTIVLSFVNVFVPKVRGSLNIKYLVAASQFLTVAGITSVLILYAYNKVYNVEDLLEITLEFGWGFYTAVAAAPLATIFMICTILNIIKTMPMHALEPTKPKTVVPEVINMYSGTNHN